MSTEELLIIRLEDDEWDFSACERLEDLLRPAYARPRVVIDMTAVTYLDSSCLQQFVNMNKERVTNRQFAAAHLVIPSANIRRLFAMVGLDKVWPIFEDLSDASRAFTSIT
jgi:anti-anti-sigma factor